MEDGSKKTRWPGFVQLFFVVSVVLCALLYAPRFFVSSSSYRLALFAPRTTARPRSVGGGNGGVVLDNQLHSPCSSLSDRMARGICCDRSSFHTDVCFMAGDVRTDAASLSFLLFPSDEATNATVVEERIRPYTRKWERFIMDMIQEVRVRVARPEEAASHRCDVRHDAPAFVMTAGGYTGNLYHAFNDGLMPAWTTVQHLRRRVVLAVLSYNPWWAGTFHEIISGLSDYVPVDLLNDKRTHCFPGAIVGSRFHGILEVDPTRLRDNKTILDFRRLLTDVYDPPNKPAERPPGRPRLLIVSRKGTRVIENLAAVVQLGNSVGFDVEILETANGAPLSAVYSSVSACHAMVGVHGADLTKFLFLRPGATLVQIVPLGIDRVAHECFGVPSAKMGLHYEEYKVHANESSLSRKYRPDDVVLTDPDTAKKNKGWDFVAKVYLSGQNVSLDLDRFRDTLARAHAHAMTLHGDATPA